MTEETMGLHHRGQDREFRGVSARGNVGNPTGDWVYWAPAAALIAIVALLVGVHG